MSAEKLLDRADGVIADVIEPAAVAVDAGAEWPEAGIRALLDAGLGGLVLPATVTCAFTRRRRDRRLPVPGS